MRGNFPPVEHKEGIVYLYAFPRCITKQMVNLSPFAIKLESWLRLKKIKYQVSISMFHTSVPWRQIRFLPRKLCFHRCLSVHGGGGLGVVCPRGVWQTCTPPSRHPPGQIDTPSGRHPPQADTLGRHTPLGRRTPLRRQPLTDPPGQTPPCGRYASHCNAFLFNLKLFTAEFILKYRRIFHSLVCRYYDVLQSHNTNSLCSLQQ